MKLSQVNNLTELLQALQTESAPMFVNLCSRCQNGNYLMDQVVSKLQKEYGEKLGYQKMPAAASAIIKEELKVSQNPVLLLIEKGEIKALFGGMVAQYKLEAALREINANVN